MIAITKKKVIKTKCRYAYCKHGGEVLKEDAVKDGKTYYHKDCLEEKQNKAKIREIYLKYYNKNNDNMAMISKCVGSLVHDKHIDSEFVLYALCQHIRQKKPLNNIYGLTYVVADSKLVAAFNKLKAIEQTKTFSDNIETINRENHITYKKHKQKTWKEILFK